MAYKPDPRDWEQKEWLYQKYWGELIPVKEIAELTDVKTRAIRDQMDEMGIPRRPRRFEAGGTVSPFSGFYNEDEVSQADEKDRSHFDEDKQPNENEEWANWNGAKENELIGEAAQFGTN